MEITEILQQPEGFTPPEVTVKINKVWEHKSGTSKDGAWSSQNVEVEGGRLKLKGLPEFPKSREGQTVTLKANYSKQHGLTGLKVNHETYKDKNYDQLLVTPSANWEWANGSQPADNDRATSVANQAVKGEPFDRPLFRRGRIHRMREAIEDALESINGLGEFDSDDIRSVAISFVIEEQRERVPIELPETIIDRIKAKLRELGGTQDEMKELTNDFFGTRSWAELTQMPVESLEACFIKLESYVKPE